MSGSGAGQSCFQDVAVMEERGQLRWIVGFVEGEEQLLGVPLLDL